MKRFRNHYAGRSRALAAAAVLGTALCTALFAAAAHTAAVAQPAAAATPTETHETVAETIARCLKDLAQDNVDQRRRAVLVLGKYNHPAARAAMRQSLNDPDATIRQSALVALSELTATPTGLVKPVLERLADPNVHIRRIAASLLPQLLRRIPNRIGTPGGQDATGIAFLRRDPEARELLNRAVAEDDPVLRKNLLILDGVVPGLFRSEVLDACLAAADPEVRLLALRACARAKPQSEPLPAPLRRLVTDPNDTVRAEFARLLGSAGDAAIPLWRRMAAEDPAPVVRAQAVTQLVVRRDPAAFELLQQTIRNPELPARQCDSLISLLGSFGERALPMLTEIATAAAPSGRASAVRTLGRTAGTALPASFFADLTATPTSAVRLAALNVLQLRVRDLDQAALNQLLESPYADVRTAAVRLSGSLPRDAAAILIGDALLDEDLDVRIAAIRVAGLRSVPDWARLLRLSLQDPSMEIRRATADTLLRRNDAQSRQILNGYLTAEPNPDLASYVRQQLQRKAKPARRPRPQPRQNATPKGDGP